MTSNQDLKVLLIRYRVRIERLSELLENNKSFSDGFKYQIAEMETYKTVVKDLEGLLK